MRRFLTLGLCISTALSAYSGKQPKDTTLFTYGDKKVSTREFVRGFTKNKHKDSAVTQKEVDEYLELYKKFRLKVQDAYDMGLDTTADFKAELAVYRKQIAKPFLTDRVVNEKLVLEAYERMKFEVKAAHILIKVLPDASPEDTLRAYNRLKKLRADITGNTISFDKAAELYSEDPSATENKGDLGYFSAFQMIYEFENWAYNTPVGNVSDVFRTQFGYHIVQVTDKRPSKGEITVRQIKIELNPQPGQDELAEAEAKINEVYKKLQAGEKFTTLVQQYSEDASTVLKNGELPPFTMTSYRYPENFRDAAFSLMNDGDFTRPIRSRDGFHIIQRISLKPLEPLDKLRPNLLNRISRDSRQYRNTLAVYERAKNYYKFKENKKYGKLLDMLADTTLLQGNFNPDNVKNKSKLFPKVLFTLRKIKKNYTVADFAKWVEEMQRPSSSGSVKAVAENYYSVFRLQTIMNYYEEDLENINDTFATLYKEYKEGILLFTLMDKKVWSKSVEDSAGLKAFFDKNAGNYKHGERSEATIFRCADLKVAEALRADLSSGMILDSVMRKYNRVNPLNVSNPLRGKFEKGNNIYADYIFAMKREGPAGFILIEDPKAPGSFILIQIHSFIPAGPKTLTEAKGAVMSDYQQQLEQEWISELMKRYPVTVNNPVYQSVRDRLIRN